MGEGGETEMVSPTELVLTEVSQPSVLDFLHLWLLCCSYSSLTVRIKSCKSCELIPSLLTSGLHSNWGRNKTLQGKN
jgi:hypothetical protein